MGWRFTGMTDCTAKQMVIIFFNGGKYEQSVYFSGGRI